MCKTGKWYGQGSVNKERYHRLLEGAKSKSEALEMDSAIRHQISLRQKGLLPPEKPKETEEPRHTIEDGIAIWKTHVKLYNVDYKHDLEKIGTLTEFFKRNNIDYLDEITISVAEKFQTYLLEEKQNNRTHTKGLKPATVNRKVAVLKKICSLAVRNRYLKENPLVKFETLEENNMRKRYLLKDEETRLLKHLPEYAKAIVYIDLRTGLRLSKVLQLKWSDINLDKKQLTLIRRKKGKPVPEILELSNDTVKLLRTLPNKSEYVFTNPRTGKPYTRIDKSFKSA